VKFFRAIDRYLSQLETFILVLTLGAMILFAFMQVILRNFFSSGIIWADTFLRHLVLWLCFLGASLATRENKHIRIDALSRLLKPKQKKWVDFFINLFSAFICGLLIRAAYVFIRDERAAETTLFLGIPLWLFMSIILIGFIIITFRFLIKAFSFDINQSSSEGN
jgi:TRAP-type C4-dicarboxylate transport system permease small subunit